jgi:hypothetical protein
MAENKNRIWITVRGMPGEVFQKIKRDRENRDRIKYSDTLIFEQILMEYDELKNQNARKKI